MLEIKQLAVAIDGKEILHDVSLTIKTGETNVLFGPNGSGKTTLLMTIMGFPKYQVTKGSIIFMGKVRWSPKSGQVVKVGFCS